jgi:hypothetical protein
MVVCDHRDSIAGLETELAQHLRAFQRAGGQVPVAGRFIVEDPGSFVGIAIRPVQRV